MAERNVNVRLQVLDGGKAKAEFASVGDAGAAALDALQRKSHEAAAAVNQLRTHEVSNLSAQLTDLGVQVLSGQSFATAMIQQGPQIAAVLGDRGVKASLVGVGTALMSLITPTTAVLAGILALGYGASYVFDAITDDADDATERLSKHEEIVRRIAERYGEAKDKAVEYTEAQRQIDILESRTNASAQAKAYAAEVDRLLREIAIKSVSTDTAGNIAENPLFEAYAAAVKRLTDGARAGAPDIEAFRGEVAALSNASNDPAVAKFGEDLFAAGAAAQEMQARMDEARASAERVGDTVLITADQIKVFKKTIADWAKDEKLIAELGSRADTASDPRQRAVNTAVGRLSESATDDQRKRAAEAAAREFDQQQAQRAQERQSREALSEARQKQNALENEAERLYRRTRSAGEAYADTVEKLNEHLAAGRIDQETYSRAVAEADEVMRQAERAVLQRATDGVSGYQRAVEDYVAAAQDMATATEDLVLNALGAGEDAFAEFAATGKVNFSSLIDSMIADLARLAYRQAMASLLSAGGGDWLGSLINGAVGALSGGFGASSGNVAGYMASGYANTNSFGGPRAMGGAVQEGIDYWVGEHGPEKFRAPRDGQIIPNHALKATNAPQVTVNIRNEVAGVGVSAGPATVGQDGAISMDVIVQQIEGRMAENVVQRRGPLGAAMETSYGLSPMRGRGR